MGVVVNGIHEILLVTMAITAADSVVHVIKSNRNG